ncbi:hypothetical protein HKD37_04G010796 [Glycine soja]
MYPPLFSLNLVDVPSTRTDPQEMYPLLFLVKPKIQKNSQAVSPLNTFVLGNGKNQNNSQTISEKGDTKEFRRLVLCSFGKGRRETQKEFRRLVLGEFFLAKGEENEKMNSTSFQGLENQKTSESFWYKEEEEVQRDSRLWMYPPLELIHKRCTLSCSQYNNPSRCTLYLCHNGCTL